MASSLTPEQKARIEFNRKLALEKRAAKMAQISQSNSPEKPLQLRQNTSLPSASSSNIKPSNLSHSRPTAAQAIVSQNTDCTPLSGYVNITSKLNLSNTNQTFKSFAPNTQSISKSNIPISNQKPIGSISSYSTNVVSPKKLDSNCPSVNLNIFKPNTSEENRTQVCVTSVSTSTSVQGKPQTRTVGECRLISKDRFTVDIPYHPQTIDVFRTVKGKEYDSKTKLWTFPLSEYFNFKKAVSGLKPYVIIGDLPKCIIETFIIKARCFQQDSSRVDISRIDPKLLQTIYPFQKEGIQYAISRGGRCLIADDMGLGKTIQALGIVDYYREDWPLLIVCPSSMRYQWEEEIRVHLPNSVFTHQVFVMTTGKDIVDGARVLILSYDLLAKKRDLIKDMEFGVVIMDESHSIKSIKTQRGKAALDVAQQCKRVVLLSGTPVLSRPAELYTQIKAVDHKAFPYFKEYGIRYCNGNETKFGWNFNGSSNMEELKILLETRFMIRRMKSSVLGQLPGKIRQVIVLNSRSMIKKNDSMDAFALKLQSTSLKGRDRHGTLLQYFSETAKTKAPAVCEYISDLLQDNRKFLCFAHHAEMLDAVCETLEKNKTFYIRIDGSVSAEDRKILCDKFQYEDKWMVAVLSIKAANTGLTLTAAQVVIFAELFWNPGDLAQAEDRVHRIGQEDCVVVKYLLAKGTADDYLWPLIQSKLEVLNQAGLSKDSYMDADTKCLRGSEEKKEKQTKIDDFFQNDEDDEDLLKVMDEIDGVQEKKIKLG